MAKGRGARLGDLVESASRVSEHFTWLDRPSYRLEHAMALTFTLFGGASDRARNVLNGTYVGHPVHPVAATVPVGAWTVALLLDAVDALSPRPPGFREATRLTVGVGVAGSAAAAVTGLADWQYTQTRSGGRAWCTASSTLPLAGCVPRPGVTAAAAGGPGCAADSAMA